MIMMTFTTMTHSETQHMSDDEKQNACIQYLDVDGVSVDQQHVLKLDVAMSNA